MESVRNPSAASAIGIEGPDKVIRQRVAALAPLGAQHESLAVRAPSVAGRRRCLATTMARIVTVLHALPQSGHETCHRVTVIYRSVTRDEGTDALGEWEGSR